MEEFSIRFLHHTITVTPVEDNHYIVSYDDQIGEVVIPAVMGTIYVRKDLNLDNRWFSDDDLNAELVELIGQMIEDRADL